MQAWEITKKDLRLLARDRRALIVLVILPLIFITIIGLTTGRMMGWNNSNTLLKIALADNVAYEEIGKAPASSAAETMNAGTAPSEGANQDADDDAVPLSREEQAAERKLTGNLIAKIHNHVQERNGFEIQRFNSADEARRQYEQGNFEAAIIVGPEFYRRFRELGPADIFDRPDRKPGEGLRSVDISLESLNLLSSRHSAIE